MSVCALLCCSDRSVEALPKLHPGLLSPALFPFLSSACRNFGVFFFHQWLSGLCAVCAVVEFVEFVLFASAALAPSAVSAIPSQL